MDNKIFDFRQTLNDYAAKAEQISLETPSGGEVCTTLVGNIVAKFGTVWNDKKPYIFKLEKVREKIMFSTGDNAPVVVNESNSKSILQTLGLFKDILNFSGGQ